MTAARPYTPDMVADRWQCSAETVRQLCKRGALRAFRIGRMYRIPAEALEEYECRMQELDDSTDASSSYGTTRTENADAIVLMHTQPRKRIAKRET